MSQRKSTQRIKLKAARQEERLQKWKEHFKNMFRIFLEITGKPIKKSFMANLRSN